MTLEEQREDARRGYALAISELRRQGIAEGKYHPLTDEEREWVRAAQRKGRNA